MKKNHFTFLLLAALLLAGCDKLIKKNTETIPDGEMPTEPRKARGELAFLLDYNGRMPGDVGFLTNHIVERRLAGLMKDSFTVLSSKTQYATPLVASPETGLIAAKYYNDKDFFDLSSVIIIDARREIFWVYYYNGDSLVKFTDNPSAPPIGPN